jgi:hypothetical protein
MLKKSASQVFWSSIILGIPIMIWIWEIGTKLQKFIPQTNKTQLIIFKASIIFPLIYVLFAIFYLFPSGNISMPLHLSAMGATCYSMIYAAKTLKSAELKRTATVSDYLGDFFLIWFFPIGIWILQSRIHKLVQA